MWTTDSEARFVNRLKEIAANDVCKAVAKHDLTNYSESVKKMCEVLSGYAQRARHRGDWPGFESWTVPLPWEARDCTISEVKGFKHVSCEKSKCMGFFFKGFMNVKEEDVFQEWDCLANELAAAAVSRQ